MTNNMIDKPFYDLTEQVPPCVALDTPSHNVDVYELDGCVHIVIQKDDCYE